MAQSKLVGFWSSASEGGSALLGLALGRPVFFGGAFEGQLCKTKIFSKAAVGGQHQPEVGLHGSAESASGVMLDNETVCFRCSSM